jgi:hypothetical protein
LGGFRQQIVREAGEPAARPTGDLAE